MKKKNTGDRTRPPYYRYPEAFSDPIAKALILILATCRLQKALSFFPLSDSGTTERPNSMRQATFARACVFFSLDRFIRQLLMRYHFV